MSNNTIKISEMEENQDISQNDIIEVSAYEQQRETYTSKKLSLARLGNWINSFLGKLITKFSPENISLTEAVDRLFDTAGGSLKDLADVSINEDTLEPRASSNRYSSVLVYDQTNDVWTNEAYPFIEYQGVIRGENTSPIIFENPETGELTDEHIIVPAGINIIDSKIFVDVDFYGNFATNFGYTDVQEDSEEQEEDSDEPESKPKKLEITFKHSPYEMTGDLNSSMNYKLRIWT